MRFDAARAVRWANQFAVERAEASISTRHPIEIVAAEFSRRDFEIEPRGALSTIPGWLAARRVADESAPARVLFATAIDAPAKPAGGTPDLRRRLGRWGARSAASPALDAWQLGLLIELASTWTTGAGRPADFRFAVASGPAAMADLALHLGAVEPARPTLVILLGRPGPGHEIIIDGRGAPLELARAAAADLWIPCRLHPTGRIRSRLRRNSCAGQATIGLRAEIVSAQPAGTSPDEPAAEPDTRSLAAIAQLATEIALRWAREHSL